MQQTTQLGIHQPANKEDESMAHKHYNMHRGQRLGFNPSAQPHDLLLGKLNCYYDKSKDKARGGRTGWDDRQVTVAITPPSSDS